VNRRFGNRLDSTATSQLGDAREIVDLINRRRCGAQASAEYGHGRQMSYDLYFKSGKRPLDRSAFEGHFRSRTWWRLEETEEGVQACYENTDTDVYFSFDWTDDGVAFNSTIFGHTSSASKPRGVTAFARAFHGHPRHGTGSSTRTSSATT
jgi:hypothetical protein